MNHLSVGYVVALTFVISFSAMHADEPPPAAPAQALSPGTNLVLKPAVWTNLTPPASKIKESNKESNKLMVCQGFAIDPQNPATIYLCVAGFRTDNYDVLEGRGLYKTTDGGAIWKRLGFDFPLHVIIDPKDSNHLYLVDGVNGRTNGFWISFDGGETWKHPAGLNVDTQTPIGMDNMYSVAADPTDFNHILVSFHTTYPGLWTANHATGVVESWDSGEHWKPHIVPTKGDNRANGCAIFFLYDPVHKIGDAKTWLFTTQYPEWYRTEDGGVTWTQVYDQAMTHGGEQLYRSVKNVLYAGGADKPAFSSDNGKTWTTFKPDCGFPFGASMGVCGDGTNIFIGPWNVGDDGCYFISPETDGLTWKPYLRGQKFTKEPFEMHYDAKNGIMYASPWQDGFWALKIAGQ